MKTITPETSVDWLEISVRVQNACKNLGLETVVDFILTPDAEWLRLLNFGRVSLNEVRDVRSQIEYKLRAVDVHAYIDARLEKMNQVRRTDKKILRQWQDRCHTAERRAAELEGKTNKQAAHIDYLKDRMEMLAEKLNTRPVRYRKANWDIANEAHSKYRNIISRLYWRSK